MWKLCRNWLCFVPSMIVPCSGTVAVRQVSKRSAQKPLVQRASEMPTGLKATCRESGGDWPTAGSTGIRAISAASATCRISLLPKLRFWPGHLDVERVLSLRHFVGDTRRFVSSVPGVDGWLLPFGHLGVAQRDRHDGDAILPWQRAIARPVGSPGEITVLFDVSLHADRDAVHRGLADNDPSVDRTAVLVGHPSRDLTTVRTAPGDEGHQHQWRQGTPSTGYPPDHGRTSNSIV